MTDKYLNILSNASMMIMMIITFKDWKHYFYRSSSNGLALTWI